MVAEAARASDQFGVGVASSLADSVRACTRWLIERFDADQTAWVAHHMGAVAPRRADFEALRIAPYSVAEVVGNLVTTAGWNRSTSLIIGGGGQAVTNTSARIGVGNGVGSAAAADTDLSASAGSSNRWFQAMDSTYPQQANAVITLRSTFGTVDGNFAWNEFGIDIGTPTVTSGATVNAVLLNHKTSIAQGTKASGQTWVATATITYT